MCFSFQAGEIIAFYNGVRLPYVPGEKEDWDTSGINYLFTYSTVILNTNTYY